MMNEQTAMTTCQTYQCSCCSAKCISWSAIITGALVGLGIGFLLKLLGVAIGLSAVGTGQDGIVGLAIGGFIGLLICTIIAMFFAGWVSGRVGSGSCSSRCSGVLYGFVTWAVILVATMLLSSHMGRFMAYNYHALSKPNPAVSSMIAYKVGKKVGQQQAMNATADSSAMTASDTAATATADAEKVASVLGLSFFLAFIMFAVGALAACIGGFCGIKRKGSCKVCCPTDKSVGVDPKQGYIS